MNLELPKYNFDFSKKVTRKELWEVHESEAKRLGYADQKSSLKGYENKVRTIVENKLDLFNYAVANNLFQEPDRGKFDNNADFHKALKIFKQAWELYDDDAIYAYAHLKWNGNPVTFYPYQDAISSDKHNRIIVECANQVGKSFFLCAASDVSFFRNHGKTWNIGLLSKSKAQNSNNMRMIKLMLSTSSLNFEAGSEENMSVTVRNIYKEDGNKITDSILYTNSLICAVASTSALGYPFDEIYADEYEFWENPEGLEYMYDQVLKPRTFQTKGRIFLIANPNGLNFVSENLQKRRDPKDPTKLEFHTYNFNFLDKPGNTIEEFEHEKMQTHPVIFASTMAAERTDAQGAAITDSQIRDAINPLLTENGPAMGRGKECVFFLDVGHVHDQCVLTGLYQTINPDTKEKITQEFYKLYYPVTYPLWRVIGLDPDKLAKTGHVLNLNDGWAETSGNYPSVTSILKEYELEKGVQPMFGADITGNEAMVPLLNIGGIYCEDIHMTGPWKAKWYGVLISLLAQRRYKIGIKDNWLDGKNKDWCAQARTLIITTKMADGRARPYPLYHHQTEQDHDDALDSSVGALSLIDSEVNGAVNFERVEDTIFAPIKEKTEEEKLIAKKKKWQEELDEQEEESLYGTSHYVNPF